MSHIFFIFILFIFISNITMSKFRGRRSSSDPKIFSTCFEGLGCVDTNEKWYDSHHRPINLEPLDRHTVRTEFLLMKTENNSKEIVYDILTMKTKTITISGFKKDKMTIFLIHDFTSNGHTGWVKHMAVAITEELDVNIVSVDWEAGAEPPFDQAIANARVVALEMVLFINMLKEKFGIDEDSVHLIGHGVGAHIAGYVGKTIIGISRITDPTGPRFENMPSIVRLDPDDAKYVEVLHTEAFNHRSQGTLQPLGHSDFYINNAMHQPGCNESANFPKFIDVTRTELREGKILPACSHKRSFKYYINAITTRACKFIGIACSSYEAFLNGSCSDCENNLCSSFDMCPPPPNVYKTRFFLNTHTDPPFCMHAYQVNISIDQHENMKKVEGYFEFILVGTDNQITFAVGTDFGNTKRTYEPGNAYTLIIYAPPPAVSAMREAKVKWISSAIFPFPKKPIYVKYITVRRIPMLGERIPMNGMCPEGNTEIKDSAYVQFVSCDVAKVQELQRIAAMTTAVALKTTTKGRQLATTTTAVTVSNTTWTLANATSSTAKLPTQCLFPGGATPPAPPILANEIAQTGMPIKTNNSEEYNATTAQISTASMEPGNLTNKIFFDEKTHRTHSQIHSDITTALSQGTEEVEEEEAKTKAILTEHTTILEEGEMEEFSTECITSTPFEEVENEANVTLLSTSLETEVSSIISASLTAISPEITASNAATLTGISPEITTNNAASLTAISQEITASNAAGSSTLEGEAESAAISEITNNTKVAAAVETTGMEEATESFISTNISTTVGEEVTTINTSLTSITSEQLTKEYAETSAITVPEVAEITTAQELSYTNTSELPTVNGPKIVEGEFGPKTKEGQGRQNTSYESFDLAGSTAANEEAEVAANETGTCTEWNITEVNTEVIEKDFTDLIAFTADIGEGISLKSEEVQGGQQVQKTTESSMVPTTSSILHEGQNQNESETTRHELTTERYNKSIPTSKFKSTEETAIIPSTIAETYAQSKASEVGEETTHPKHGTVAVQEVITTEIAKLPKATTGNVAEEIKETVTESKAQVVSVEATHAAHSISVVEKTTHVAEDENYKTTTQKSSEEGKPVQSEVGEETTRYESLTTHTEQGTVAVQEVVTTEIAKPSKATTVNVVETVTESKAQVVSAEETHAVHSIVETTTHIAEDENYETIPEKSSKKLKPVQTEGETVATTTESSTSKKHEAKGKLTENTQILLTPIAEKTELTKIPSAELTTEFVVPMTTTSFPEGGKHTAHGAEAGKEAAQTDRMLGHRVSSLHISTEEELSELPTEYATVTKKVTHGKNFITVTVKQESHATTITTTKLETEAEVTEVAEETTSKHSTPTTHKRTTATTKAHATTKRHTTSHKPKSTTRKTTTAKSSHPHTKHKPTGPTTPCTTEELPECDEIEE